MRNKTVASLLVLALLLGLGACGKAPAPVKSAAPEEETAPPSAPSESAAALPAPGAPTSAALSFPLLAAPFSEDETQEMINHNARRCALLDVNFYYCCCLYSDGSRTLVRYEVIDNGLHHRTVLAEDCPADDLCEAEGRLYYLGGTARAESIALNGADRRTELDVPCRSLQLVGGTLWCLTQEGTLLALRGGEAEPVLGGCGWAFVSSQGIFYTAAADGRAHLFDPAARTDVTLTAEAAEAPVVVGSELIYTARESGGSRLCALDLQSGAARRQETAFAGAAELLRDERGAWALRLTQPGGAAGQRLVALDAAFDTPLAARETGDGELCRMRGLDDMLRTDELLASDGSSLGFALVLPGGGRILSLAADNPRG